jgi:hypothetical protein
MEISPVEVLQELERQYPLQLKICIQTIQIRKLTEQQDDTDDE